MVQTPNELPNFEATFTQVTTTTEEENPDSNCDNCTSDCDDCCDCEDGCEDHVCVFCGTGTNFEDKGRFFCIDCYVKLRNSAHTHDMPVNPQPLTPLSPFPGLQSIPFIC